MPMHISGIVLAVVLSIFPWVSMELDNPWLQEVRKLEIQVDLSWLIEANDYDLTEPTTSSSVYRGMGNGTTDVDQWIPLVAGFFDYEDRWRVACLMRAESGGNPNAYNPSGASGLMQVMPYWAGVYGVSLNDLFNPSINLWIAHDLRVRYGWTQWSPYNRGLCRGL